MKSETDTSAWLLGLADAAGLPPGPVSTSSMDVEIGRVLEDVRRRRRRRTAFIVAGAVAAAAVVLVAWRGPGLVGIADEGSGRGFQAEASVPLGSPARAVVPQRPQPRGRVGAGITEEPVEPEEPQSASPESLPAVESVASPRRVKTQHRAPTAADLLAQAQRARAARDTDAARAALLAVRERFPSDPAAEHATFLLGRVEHEMAKRPGVALEWFERYVEQYPEGRYIAQARGRSVHHRSSHGSPARAREVAAEYLEHHAAGPYADLARAVLEPATP